MKRKKNRIAHAANFKKAFKGIENPYYFAFSILINFHGIYSNFMFELIV